MKYARIENDVVMEIINFSPVGKFHPSIIWVGCGNDVKEGYLYDGGVFSEPTNEDGE